MEIKKLLIKPEIGSLLTIELTMIHAFSLQEENNQIAIYVLNDPEDDRWKSEVNFVVLGTGDIPEKFRLFSPIGTINVNSNILHIFYRIKTD